MARDFDGLAFQDDQLASSGHMAEELCWKEQKCISWFYRSTGTPAAFMWRLSHGRGADEGKF